MYTKVFRNKDNLAELFDLYTKGMKVMALAEHFKVNHASIIYQIQKKFGGHKREVKQKCPKCEMLLNSPYHIKNPCK